MHAALNILSAIFSFCAAIAWIRSATVFVIYDRNNPPKQTPNPRGVGSLPQPAILYGYTKGGDAKDLIPTLKKQGTWNGYAAWLAAIAAILQGIVVFCYG